MLIERSQNKKITRVGGVYVEQAKYKHQRRVKRFKGFRPLRWVFFLAMGFTTYQLFSKPSGVWQMWQLYQKNLELENKIDSLKTTKITLEKERHLLKTDSGYMEKTARSELGMAKPSEKVFRFVK